MLALDPFTPLIESMVGFGPSSLWTPRLLSAPIKFWLYPGTASAHPDVSVNGSSDATSIVDHNGGAVTLAGSNVAFDGTTSPLNGRAYLKHRYQSRTSQLTGTGIGITGTAPWTMCCAVRVLGAPSTGNDASSMMILGPSGGGTPSQYLGTSKTGSLYQIAAVSGLNITYPFGTEVLADGTPGTTLPSIQILGGVWDGTYIWQYLDGALINTTKANTTTFGAGCYNSQGNPYTSNIANPTGAFGFYPWFFTQPSVDYDIFEALWCAGASTSAEMAKLAAYMINGLAIPKTARGIVFVGDSYCEGTGANDGGGTVTKYVSCIPTTGNDTWGSLGTDYPHWTVQMIAQAGTPMTGWNRGHAGAYATDVEINRPGWVDFELGNTLAPRRTNTQPLGLLELLVNDVFLAKTEAQWQAGLEYIASAMRTKGIDMRYVLTAPPDIEGGSISTNYITRRTWNDWLRANFASALIGTVLVDLEDMANSYVVPASLGGVSTWTATTAYKLGDRVLAPNGFTYQYEAAGTSGGSAPTTFGTGIVDGTTTVFAVDTNPARQTSHAYKIADRITVGGAGGTTWQCFVTPTSGGTGNSGTGPDPSGTADFVDGQITWRRVSAPNTLGSFLAELPRPSAHTTNGTDLHYRAFGYKVVGMAVSRAIRLDLGLP